MSKDQLNYLIAKQGLFSVISFIGDITEENTTEREITPTGESLNAIERCYQEIESSDSRYFIFNLREVGTIERSLYKGLIQIQSMIRNKKKSFLVCCGVRPDLRKDLVADSVLRDSEIVNNVKEGIKELSKIELP